MPRSFNVASITLSLELNLPISAASFIESKKSYTDILLCSPLHGSTKFATHISFAEIAILFNSIYSLRYAITLIHTCEDCQGERIMELRVVHHQYQQAGVFQPVDTPEFSIIKHNCACFRWRYSLTSVHIHPIPYTPLPTDN
ncbi:hypothetical protein L798_09063 [Zootermopsis nevadensis]|uniref:Uncharacterized protein n=1 Tax=Zootermopsis nevadensis TaxID=136037 RepID=A0A067QPF8_ZOONE|nr:hypothetical protein L798_09063 [Zootermopsis nevadensis]